MRCDKEQKEGVCWGVTSIHKYTQVYTSGQNGCETCLPLELSLLNKERHVADHHIQIAVPPVRVPAKVLVEDGAERRLVLGHEPRPLVEHEADRAYEQRRILHGHCELFPHTQPEELREASFTEADETDILRQPLCRRRERLVEDEKVDEVCGIARGHEKVGEPRRQLVHPRHEHRDAEARVACTAWLCSSKETWRSSMGMGSGMWRNGYACAACAAKVRRVRLACS